MPFDDEDTPGAQLPAALAAQASEDAPTAEETMEEEAQDFRLFASLINKKNISSKSIRKGEKDFEEHGTKLQANALEQSRQVMEEVLSFTRVHKKTNWLRGWYFPDRWADAVEPEEAEAPQSHGEPREAAAKRRGLDARDRVIVVEHDKGHFKTMGRIVTGQGKDQPGWDKIWLLPEEALFLLERGSLDLWWPTRPLADIFPIKPDPEESVQADQLSGEEDEYDLGVPLSLEAAYSLLIGNDKERGKITLQTFQVYSNLSRGGYRILRAPSSSSTLSPPVKQPLWQWLVSLLHSDKEPRHAALGPLVHPGLYRSYKSIYKQLAIIPRHKPSQGTPSPWEIQEPFKIQYHVWKAGTLSWSKTRPPPPDFYLAIVDTRETYVPTLEEISALLDSSPWDPPSKWDRPGQIYPRLKWGWRNVLVAVVDHGIVNFVRFGEGAFGEEPLYPRFDSSGGPRGGKRGGGRNQRNGRGGGRGRGGRGRGR